MKILLYGLAGLATVGLTLYIYDLLRILWYGIVKHFED